MRPLCLTLGITVLLAFSSSGSRADCTINTPNFDLTGPVCSSAPAQAEPCRCSEGMEWDPVPTAEWYEVQRTDGATTLTVGDTRWRNHPSFEIDGDNGPVTIPAYIETRWFFAWDNPFPIRGTTYTYSVRACRQSTTPPGNALCSATWSNTTNYVAPIYYCYTNGVEVPC